MKLIIAGSRHLNGGIVYAELLHRLFDINDPNYISSVSEIVSGGCRGVDKYGELIAKRINIKCTIFLADWNKFGEAAGPIRNKQMAEYADALLLVWDGKSRGSKNIRKHMIALGKPIYEIIIQSNSYDMEL